MNIIRKCIAWGFITNSIWLPEFDTSFTKMPGNHSNWFHQKLFWFILSMSQHLRVSRLKTHLNVRVNKINILTLIMMNTMRWFKISKLKITADPENSIFPIVNNIAHGMWGLNEKIGEKPHNSRSLLFIFLWELFQ